MVEGTGWGTVPPVAKGEGIGICMGAGKPVVSVSWFLRVQVWV